MGNPYNPQTQILIRDWANAHHYELASLIAYLQRHGVDIEEVNNPYAQQLMHRHDSFSPIARVIPVTSSRWLDSFARMMGPVERQRSLHVTFHEQDSGDWAVPADDEGLDHADIRWWLLRPPSMVLDQPVKEVRASDFNWKPPIVVDTISNTLYIYGLAEIMNGPTFINGVRCAGFEESSFSNRNPVPGGWRWGKFGTNVPMNKISQLLGQ